jgi:hypothetical protein
MLFATHRYWESFFVCKNMMISKFTKPKKIVKLPLKQEEFLEEHNKLSPENLRVTMLLLSRFRTEKASLFKDETWSMEKLRRPLILWLTSLTFGK